jgi:hypothetical protein
MFCSNPIDSEEHLWPKWVHERKDFGPIKLTRGSNPTKTVPHPQVTVRAVCETCNKGWMSRKLEVPNIPIVGGMMQNLSINLDHGIQQTVATWCMKMAFLTDWTRVGGRQRRFYTKDETLAFATDLSIPPHTRIWIGHINTSHLSTDGHDFELLLAIDKARIGISSTVTIVIGHFVAQIVTDHIRPECAELNFGTQPGPGPWDTKLIQIWPIEKEWVMWPPKDSFTNGGREGIGYLLRRWRTGKQIDQII